MTNVTRGVRRVVGTPAPRVVPPKLKILAKDFYVQNAAANKATNTAKKTRKDLLVGMTDADLKNFTFTATVDGKSISLIAEAGAAERSVIDVQKLQKLVDMDTFLKIVSASIESVVEQAGQVIADQCTKTVKGSVNATVKPVK